MVQSLISNIHTFLYLIKVCYRDAFNYFKVNLFPYSVYFFSSKKGTHDNTSRIIEKRNIEYNIDTRLTTSLQSIISEYMMNIYI